MRRTFKAMLAAALILAAASMVLSASLFTRINQSRVQIIFQSCREQNHRHDKAFEKLDSLIAHIPDPVERAQAKRRANGSKALIATLAPHQDCRALVRRRFGPDAKPK